MTKPRFDQVRVKDILAKKLNLQSFCFALSDRLHQDYGLDHDCYKYDQLSGANPDQKSQSLVELADRRGELHLVVYYLGWYLLDYRPRVPHVLLEMKLHIEMGICHSEFMHIGENEKAEKTQEYIRAINGESAKYASDFVRDVQAIIPKKLYVRTQFPICVCISQHVDPDKSTQLPGFQENEEIIPTSIVPATLKFERNEEQAIWQTEVEIAVELDTCKPRTPLRICEPQTNDDVADFMVQADTPGIKHVQFVLSQDRDRPITFRHRIEVLPLPLLPDPGSLDPSPQVPSPQDGPSYKTDQGFSSIPITTAFTLPAEAQIAHEVFSKLYLESESTPFGSSMRDEYSIRGYYQTLPFQIYTVLVEWFSEEELRELCLYLEVIYEYLPAHGRKGKARELVAHFTQSHQLLDLKRRIIQQRPDIDWSQSSTLQPPAHASWAYKHGRILFQTATRLAIGFISSLIGHTSASSLVLYSVMQREALAKNLGSLNLTVEATARSRSRNAIIGVDFGTTCCAIALPEELGGISFETMEGITLIKSEEGQLLIPSYIAWNHKHQFFFGSHVKAHLREYATSIAFAKRSIGTRAAYDQGSPTVITAKILHYLRQYAEKCMDQRVQEVVITVPAHFNEKQKQEIVTAGSRAKFEQVFLLEEPVAAALAYYRNDNPVSVRCLTYDLGGGTFEAAVLQKAAGGDFGILASAWSEQVSGCNFDERLAGWLFDQLKQQYDQLDHIHRESPEWNILLVLAEKAKIALSLQTSFRLYEENSGILDKKGKPLKIDVIISRETFEDLITDDIEETIGLCHHVLAKAQISLNTLDDIVMVGGSVHIPYVRQRVEEEFRGRVRYDQRPELLVVMGAALEARRYQIRQVF